jgi:hypothetical protein
MTPGQRYERSPKRRAQRLRALYGITPEDYDRMLDQQRGVCAICEGTCSTGYRLAVDHDHKTGRVRGLLCRTCHQLIGKLNDDPARALRVSEYLTKFPG